MTNDFLRQVELSRQYAQQRIADTQKKLAEQYFTPIEIGNIMVSMFRAGKSGTSVSILDPCCGVGNLAAAVLTQAIKAGEKPQLTLVESDARLAGDARKNFNGFDGVSIFQQDFFDYVQKKPEKFDRIILNPPYSKIPPNSAIADVCRRFLGHYEPNMYSAFIACCLELLKDDGELVAIVPRSFCNGTMFKCFRNLILSRYYINALYLFESRKIFADAGVLQETLILKISTRKVDAVEISHENKTGAVRSEKVSFQKISFVGDEHRFIHIPVEVEDDELLSKMAKFPQTLISLGLRASTGKIVDFRSTAWLRQRKSSHTIPLIYHDAVKTGKLIDFSLRVAGKSPYIKVMDETRKLLIARDNYVLVRRISFKESGKRIICSSLLQRLCADPVIAIENHLNYIWGEKSIISERMCLALTAYLSTVSVDRYIRRFSGHTQINAADLNSIPVPSLSQLEEFGQQLNSGNISTAHQIAEQVFFC